MAQDGFHVDGVVADRQMLQDRRDLAAILAKSWDCGWRTADVVGMLEDGQLVQYTVHLSRPDDFEEESRRFIANDLAGDLRDDGGSG